jgi:hypothetical protein
MSVYKINHLATNTIYVFCGNVPIETTDPTSFFSKDENNTIKEKKTSVKLVNHLIHIDDTIGTIKTKLIMYLDLNLALEELYLFYRKHETLNSVSIYKTLVQSQKKSVKMVIVNKDKERKTKSGKKSFELTKPLLDQILLNIYSDSKGTIFSGLPEKPLYTMDDILQLKLDNHTFVVDNVLGQKKSLNEGTIPFIYNPNNMVVSTTKQIDAGNTFNNKLLMDSGDIINNTIYLCTTTDILGKTIPDPLLIQLYFPSLKNVTSLEELTGKREELITQNKKIVNDSTSSLFNAVDLFYNIHSSKTKELDYKKKGIKYIKAVLKPDFNIKMPLEIIYKLLHATQSYPFIKYNPSSRQENSYRLFADRTATDGRKIPYLKKSEIFSLMKTMGRGKSVSVFVSNKDSSLVCEFDELGSVIISSEFKTIVTLEQIDDLFRVSVNPILDEIKAVLEQSGYNIKLFNNLLDDSVDIQQLTYACDVAIQKAVNLDEIKGCVSSIFNNESTDFKSGIHLRFKRVSNFNKITSQEAFVIEMLKQSYSGDEIVKALMDNYKDDLTKEQAGDLVNKVANENNAERGKKKIRFDENPGFRTTLELDKRTGILSIEIDNINNIRHLTTLPIYIDSMLRLTQDIKSSGVDVEQIQKLCTSMAEHVDVPLYKESEVELDTDKPLTDGLVEIDGDLDGDVNPDDLSTEAPKANFNFLFDDEDEDDEDGGDDNSAKEGGAVLPSIIDIDGTKIKKPNYFQKRIEDRDGVLIMKKDSVKYNSYSRTCSSDFRRQPVILNDAELEKINKEHDGFLQKEDVIKYGSDKDKQFNYVCPRYWCLKTNTIILPSELEEKTDADGNKYLEHPTCGKILPPDATKIIPGHYIYEFYKPKKGDPKFKRYPGLQVDKHPDGYCLPCCFDLYTELGETFIQDKCQKRSDSEKADADKSKTDSEFKVSKNSTAVESSSRKPNQKKDDEPDDYIKGPDKFPITQGRWGYMPVDVQKLLNEVNIDCQVNRASDTPCMLRHGVENNENQSFIACISDFMFWGRKRIVGDKSELIKVPPSIREMKQNILKSLTIDNFVKYQNGNLVSSFDVKSIEGLNMNDYKNVKAFESLDINKPEELIYFTRVVSSFENFKKYLEDDKVVIDHTYLWDILTTPNKLLFPKGINLVILNLPRDDITHNVQIICPSNQYSSIPYDLNKPSMILIKIDNYYEPVYSYGSTIIKEFKSDNEKLSENIRGVLQTTIKNVFDVNCKPLDSMPNRKNARVFPAYNATPLSTIVASLERIKCKIVKQVVNYNNKVIGIVSDCSKIDAGTGFIPCYPSAPLDEYKVVFMFDTGIWNTYENTHNFLSKLNKNTGIRCRPVFKVIEDEVIVGILTETNQFVQLSQPVVSVEKDIDLHSIYNDSYIVDTKQKNMVQTDTQITTATGVDTDRVDYTNKIKMETNFYNVFRNTIRILLNDYDNVKLREQIEKLISNMYIIYSDKIKTTIKLLTSLVDDNIHFSGDENYYKIVNEVSTCIKNKKCGSSKVCAVTDDGKCSLILPEKNLITGKQNSDLYYEKIADELIRYSRIKSFMFQPQTYLAFGNIGYNLRENEIILIQSLLTQEYFERLIPIVANKYVSKNSIDTAKPNITQNYDNKVKNSDVSMPNRIDESLVESDGLYKDINAEVNDSDVKQLQQPETEPKDVADKVVEGDKEKEKENVDDEEVNDDNGNCELKYSKITSSFWRKQFPIKFVEMSYGICGYKLMIDLIKSKTNEDKTINQLKNELFAEYNKYYEKHRDKILDVLTFEGKKIMCDLVKKGKLAFADFIQNDAYNMTTFDFLLFADKYQIPSVFVSQKNILQTNYSKQMFIGHGTKSDLFAFIYVPVLKSKQDPVYKLIVTDKKDLFMSLDVMVDKQILDQSFTNPLVIEEYLSAFSKALISKKSNL